MPVEYDQEVRDAAAGLYIVDGMTYAQVAERLGVSESQIQRWSADAQWRAQRAEYRESLRSIDRDTVKLRAGLIRTALETMDPQAVYAVARLEAVAARKPRPGAPEKPQAPDRPIDGPAEAVAALKEALEIRVNRMLQQPEAIDLASLKKLKESFDFLEKLELKYRPEAPAEEAGISGETIDRIRREIMGV